MCRILLVRSSRPFSISAQLKPFAQLSQQSREYQGHGWGCSWLSEAAPSAVNADDSAGAGGELAAARWQHYHCIDPIWQDNLEQFGSSTLLLVHARSAFRDEGIVVENNMPFSDGQSVFVFNGELRGVRIFSPGRIGAEKIYNYIRRMDKGGLCQAVKKAVTIIERRTSYVRAMNIIVSDGSSSVLSTRYNEDPDYFQMYRQDSEQMQRVCSRPFPGESDWCAIPDNTTVTI